MRLKKRNVPGMSKTPCPCVAVVTIAVAIALSASAAAQTLTILHNFTGGGDGARPEYGVVIDRGGNLYGAATEGGCPVCAGIAFQMKRAGSGFAFNPLHIFGNTDDVDGEAPAALIIGPNGTIYGTTLSGGGECDPNECGVVYNVFPMASVCKTALCPWNESLPHVFGPQEGHGPAFAPPLFDAAGNIYGTTSVLSDIYKLVPSGNNHWTLNVLYTFTGGPDGTAPLSGVILDGSGNLYGTASEGGISTCQSGCGTVFELSPSGGGWTLTTLHPFQGSDGQTPVGGLIFDAAGNLYGTTSLGGANGGGTVFELSPSHGSWTLTTLYSFSGNLGPYGALTMDAAGNLYGTTLKDGANGQGAVFKLTKNGQSWMYTSLHDFTGGSDGGQPYGSVTFDANGNLYGTAAIGGNTVGQCDQGMGCGVVWEISSH